MADNETSASNKTDGSVNSKSNQANSTSWNLVLTKRKYNDVGSADQTNPNKRSHPRDPRNTAKPTVNNGLTTIISNNKFSLLSPMDETEPPSNEEPEKRSRPPPIHLKSQGVNYLELCKYLTDLVGSDGFSCSSNYKGITIYPASPESYRKIVLNLRNNNAEFFTYQLSEDKPFKIVLRGIHPSIGENNVSAEISKLGYKVRKVCNVLSREKIALPLYFVDLEPDPINQNIFNLSSMFHSKIKVEEPRKKRQLVQCTRCQSYGHTKGYCTLRPRCVRCAEDHEAINCPKSRETPAVCVLCGGSHPANYRGCLFHRQLQNRRASRPNNSSASKSFSLDKNSFPPLQSKQNSSPPSVPLNPYRSPSISYSRVTSNIPQDNILTDNISTQISSFLSEMKGLITPMITLMSQLIQAFINKNDS